MFYEPDKRDPSVLRHDPFKAIVAPRPIGWNLHELEGRGELRAVFLFQRRQQ